jgi:uncharacterized protein (TIGR03435 family)
MVIARIERKRYIGRKPLFIVVALMAVTATVFGQLTSPQQAQAATTQAPPTQLSAVPQWQTAAGGKMTFEVASVRLSKPDAPERGREFLAPFDDLAPKGGLFRANVRLFGYILFAYKISDASQWPSLMEHLPKWAQTDQFDIEARAEGSPTKDQLRLMMQSLLEERFKLVIHTETRQLPVYALVLDEPGKLGAQFHPHPDNVPCSDRPDKPVPVAPGAAPPPYCGVDVWRVNGRLHARMVDVPMEQIASLLGGFAGFLGGRDPRPILDRTGLSGKFDMNIEFVKDSGGPGTDSDVSGPTFTAALKNQLGLKLVKQTGAVPVFVIDHIERPSEN